MKPFPENPEKILDHHIPGYHQYVLDGTPRLSFVSQNLCDLLCCKKEDLMQDGWDGYAALVHPEDRESYTKFISALSQTGGSRNLCYRLLLPDGKILHVSDSMAVSKQADGTLTADSTLSDITALQEENRQLRFLNETVPCGFMRYTCEKFPRVTYLNDQMLRMLRFPENGVGSEELDFYRGNIYMMIPLDQRRRFSEFLQQVYTQETTIAGELTVQRFDGTNARLYGWVTRCKNEQGQEEFQSVCMDVTDRYRRKKEQETEQYIKALSEVYDKIFKYDFESGTVTCLYGQNSGMFRWLQNIPMPMEEATEQWISGTVEQGDLARVREFFRENCKQTEEDSLPPQIKYRAMSSSGEVRTYAGIFLNIGPTVRMYCCRHVVEEQENSSLRSENVALRTMNENMQELVMRFTEGIVAFEVLGDQVRPLYSSDNVCQFFGYSKEQWLKMAREQTSIRQFVSRSGVEYESFMKLLEVGEAEFTYMDTAIGGYRRIKAVCSHKQEDPGVPRYVMLYNLEEQEKKIIEAQPERQVYIRTFGYFDVFVGGTPIAFRNKKSKELFALLVDRRGGYVSSEEAISYLWEDEPANSVTLARYRKVALRLKNILEEYGIADIVEAVDGKRRIVPEKLGCDLYDYLSGTPEHAQLFKGSYLTNYSWGENTLGELLGDAMF